MDQAKIMLLKTPRVDEMIGAGEGLDVIAMSLINQTKVRKGLKMIHDNNSIKATIKRFLKSIAAGTLEHNGKMHALPNANSSSVKPLFPSNEQPNCFNSEAAATEVCGSLKFVALRRTKG